MINLIDNYALTAWPSVTNEESMTALQLAGRNAAKTNEIANYLNNVVDGDITEKIKEKINNSFIEGIYNSETETLVLALTFPE